MQAFAQFSFTKIEIKLVWTIFLILAFIPSGQNKNIDSFPSLESHRFADPQLIGPENLCIVFGGVIGTFSGGGDPGDVYTWKAIDPNGNEFFNRTGGGAPFETVKISFNEIGLYQVSLSVRRGTQIIYQESQTVRVQKGPSLELKTDYLLCGSDPVELIAIDPSTSNLEQYTIIWRNIEGDIIGNGNSIFVNKEGYYKVEFFQTSSTGSAECVVNGSTYVGPSLDFKLTLSQSTLCQGESQKLGLDTPISGDWFLIKPGNNTPEPLGSAFEVNLKSEEIQALGTYTVIFSAIDENYPGCRSERRTTFEVREKPKIDIRILEKPDNCSEPNGSFLISALSDLDSVRIVELDYLETNLGTGNSISLSNLNPQVYTIQAYSNLCKFTTLLDLDTKNPPITNPSTPDIFEPNYEITAESCTENGVKPGVLTLQFQQGQVNGTIRALSPGFGEVQADNITAQDQVQFTLSGGTYLIELKIDGCTYPVREITIPSLPQVNFSNPGKINICEQFELIPETNENLTFTLIDPDGLEESRQKGESFVLTKEGTYRLIGESNEANGNCPREINFEATLSDKIQFDLELFEEDCFGNQVYRVIVENFDISKTSIRWLNDQGEIVGRGEYFYPTALGDYTVTVQPLASGFCEVTPIPFSILPPVLSVPVDLIATKICPDPATAIVTLDTQEEEVDRVEWIFYDENNNREDLIQFENLFEIEIDRPGNYEAVVYNKIGCEIGRNFIPVENSTLLTEPNLDERYAICSKPNSYPGIDPGSYALYEWYFEGQLISTAPIFKPDQVGEYTLIVSTADNCVFSDNFETYDACNFQVIFPDAMVVGDPNQDFRVIVNEGITEAELFIFNRFGELVHHDITQEIPIEYPFFNWDGTSINGRKAPIGTLAVLLIVRNSIYGFEEKITGSLLVID
ncbi:hypothetical protein E4S40_13360 [Algoriphagus kandeliae]|uniref:Gliding motility-associated C-terminal domain-containing protein n=1 Tax=Algoriphagus kandeliae TaxID=2562278 RepID=A0A4Y9QKK8_9BACT|nr:hypothetical protein [Algoriphagus kandeliae]TFV93244.1 hypothetical protein E4S40_13360 [Algoriphagus kandeliae]